MDDWIDESAKKSVLPGASYAVFRVNKLIRQSYHGYSDIERKEPITKGTLFPMYSMTKPIISIGLMMLYEQRKFDLTDNVSKYIPNFGKIPGIYDYESNKDLPLEDITMDNIATNKVKLKPIKKPILMWQLMTHMSRLSYYFDKKGVFEPVDKFYGEWFGSLETTPGFDNILLSDVIDNTITKLPLCYDERNLLSASNNAGLCDAGTTNSLSHNDRNSSGLASDVAGLSQEQEHNQERQYEY